MVIRSIQSVELPGVYVGKIESRQGLRPDSQQGSSPYSFEEYIRHGRQVDLIDSKRLSVTLRGNSDTKVVRVRGGTRCVKNHNERCHIHWKHWKNMAKGYVLDIIVELFVTR